MKRVEATIRPQSVSSVVEALKQTGSRGVTVITALGHGVQGGLTQRWRGDDYSADLLPKVTLWTVVPDEEVVDVLETIAAASRTGAMGDGKITVSPLVDAVRIRTGDRGDSAIRVPR